LLDDFGGAAAAYSLRALSRGWVAGDVVEVRRSSDSTSQDFTASQITGGQMLSFVNNDTTSLYNSARYFNGANTTIDLDSDILLDGKFRIQFTTLGAATGDCFLADGSGFSYFRISGATNPVMRNVATTQLSMSIVPAFKNVPQTMLLTRDAANLVSFYIDGVLEDTGTLAGDITFNRLGSRTGNDYIDGSMTDISFDIGDTGTANHAYTGLGTSVTAWEDTIGSNDGTETNGAAYTGQPFDGFVSTEYDQSGVTVRDGTQGTTTEQIKIVDAGAVVLDGNSNISTLWDGIDDDLDVIAGFAGLTSANVYAVTDNAGVVTLATLTAQDISLATNLSTILTSLTYDKVTAVIIYPDVTDQAGIQAFINDLYGI
jgi:hypothetical protein